MSVRIYELPHDSGVVLVDSVTSLPLSLPVTALQDEGDAEAFLRWLDQDARTLAVAELEEQLQRYREDHHACEGCGSSDPTRQDDAGSWLCADCSFEADRPDLCCDRIRGGLCGNTKDPEADRCDQCQAWRDHWHELTAVAPAIVSRSSPEPEEYDDGEADRLADTRLGLFLEGTVRR